MAKDNKTTGAGTAQQPGTAKRGSGGDSNNPTSVKPQPGGKVRKNVQAGCGTEKIWVEGPSTDKATDSQGGTKPTPGSENRHKD